MIGTVEKVEYTIGGMGNQWTTIDGNRYATYFDLRDTPVKVGCVAEYEYGGVRTCFNPPAAVAIIRRVIPTFRLG